MRTNKQYITVEGSDWQHQRGGDSKAIKNCIQEVESVKEVRRVLPYAVTRPSPLQPRLLASGSNSDSRRDHSPTFTAITTHEDYFREMEAAILSQNNNLKEHNNFLKSQIESMFERERKYKSHLNSHRERTRQLQAINVQLQQQIQFLISTILSEIQRIQTVIEEQRDLDRSLSRRVFEITPKHSEAASETQSTIHKDLQDLKAKVKEIYNKKYTPIIEEPIAFHRTQYKSQSSRAEESRRDSFPLKQPETKDQQWGNLHVPSHIGRPKADQRARKPKGM